MGQTLPNFEQRMMSRCFALLLSFLALSSCATNIDRTLVITGAYGRLNNVLIFSAKALLEVQRTGSRLLFCADLEFWTQGMDTVANEGSLFDVFDFSELTHHFSVDFLTRGGKNCLRCMENSDSTRAQRRMRSREKGAV
jgi:hypothetical protein